MTDEIPSCFQCRHSMAIDWSRWALYCTLRKERRTKRCDQFERAPGTEEPDVQEGEE